MTETKNKLWIDGKLCPGIQPHAPPPLKFSTRSFRESLLSNPEFFQTLPFWNFGLNLKPPFRKGSGCPLRLLTLLSTKFKLTKVVSTFHKLLTLWCRWIEYHPCHLLWLTFFICSSRHGCSFVIIEIGIYFILGFVYYLFHTGSLSLHLCFIVSTRNDRSTIITYAWSLLLSPNWKYHQ